MELIRGFCGKLRGLAVTLDLETARLQRALEGEDSDSEDYSMRTLYDLCSEVQTLKDDVTILLDKAYLESQENIDFMKATKLLMKKNSMDIMKITEYFQKYGYNLHTKKNSVDDYDINDSKVESVKHEEFQKSDMKDDLSDLAAPSSSVSEKSPRSPQLSDFGLERYMISHVLPNGPQVVNNCKEEPEIITPSTKESLVTVPKTPKCVLKMDDFECITPKLEHFGISDYTLCLNDDYTIGLKNMEKNKCEQFLETELMSNDISTVSPDPIIQRLEKNAWQATHDVFDMPNTVTTKSPMDVLLGPLEQIDEQQEDSDNAEYTNSPLAPTFCTPGLKIPSTKNSRTLMSTSYPLSETNCSSDELEMKDCIPLVFSSDECFKNFTAPSSPKISSCENLLQTPTPPDVTTIPEDVLQILSKYSSNLATPSAVKAMPRSKEHLTKYEKQNIRGIGNKENW